MIGRDAPRFHRDKQSVARHFLTYATHSLCLNRTGGGDQANLLDIFELPIWLRALPMCGMGICAWKSGDRPNESEC